MIICAALRIDTNTEDDPILVCSYRHSDCYQTLWELNTQFSKDARQQGLITEGFLATGNRLWIAM